MNGRFDAEIECPYYRDREKQFIKCEGPVKDSSLKLTFATPQQLMDYRKEYCRSCWKTCLIAGMLNRKWGYDA